MNQEEKIDKILEKVTATEKTVALLDQSLSTFEERIEHGEGRIEKLEKFEILFTRERSNILFVLKLIGKTVVAVAAAISLFILIANFIHPK